ncbi:unnamed protein product, partial [Allacma fusca]
MWDRGFVGLDFGVFGCRDYNFVGKIGDRDGWGDGFFSGHFGIRG